MHTGIPGESLSRGVLAGACLRCSYCMRAELFAAVNQECTCPSWMGYAARGSLSRLLVLLLVLKHQIYFLVKVPSRLKRAPAALRRRSPVQEGLHSGQNQEVELCLLC